MTPWSPELSRARWPTLALCVCLVWLAAAAGEGRADVDQDPNDLPPVIDPGPVPRSPLSDACFVSALNRSVQASPDGTFQLTNIPANQGVQRARFVCTNGAGGVTGGQTAFYSPSPNAAISIGDLTQIVLGAIEPIPTRIRLQAGSAVLNGGTPSTQVTVLGDYADSSTRDLTSRTTGTLLASTNPAILALDPAQDGRVLAVASGSAFVSARNEGVTATVRITVSLGSDGDGDGMPDDFERPRACLNISVADAAADPDGDGLTNFQEFMGGSEPCVADTDGDGLTDGQEPPRGSNPVLPDSDFDGVLDGAEPAGNFDNDALDNILDRDSDNDGLPDGVEVRICGTIVCANPSADADGDQISNLDEVLIATDPLDADSDDDGLTDGFEVVAQTDPLVADRVAPAVALTVPAPGVQVVRSSTATLNATATDAGRVTRVDFYVNGARVWTDFASPYTASVSVPDSLNSLSVEVRATDTNNNTGTTGPLSVGVRSDPLTTVTGLVLDNAALPAPGAVARVRLPEIIADTGTTTIAGDPMSVDAGTHIGTSSLSGTMVFDAGDRGFFDTAVDLAPAGTLDVSGTLTLDFTGNNPSSPTPRSGTLTLTASRPSGFSLTAQGPITGVLPVTGQLPIEIDLPVTAFDPAGLSTATPLQGRSARVRLLGTLAIQALAGTSTITGLNLTGSPELIVTPAATAVTGIDGRFSVGGVPTIFGDLLVDATFTTAGGARLQGTSSPTPAVRGGTTDVGTVALAAPPAVTVFPYPHFKVGRDPGGTATGDFNGDGNDDLAVTAGSDNQIFILLGDGRGTFGPDGINFTVGARLSSPLRPVWIVSLDLNNDGRLDLAAANIDSDSVTTFLGNGAGGFSSAGSFATGSRPETLSTGDFNGDGRADLVTAQRNSSDVSILIGNGDGTFKPQVRIAIPGGPRSTAVGDLNGDGNEDIATANVNGDTVTVLTGQGNGSFTIGATLAVGDGPHSVVIRDFDGDGRRDIAVANYLSDDVSVLLGHGDGTFAPQVRYPVGDGPETLLALDLNGGGAIDLVTIDFALTGYVSVLPGNGNGTFRPRRDYAAGFFPHGLSVGDFNRDGVKDVGFGLANNSAAVMFGRRDGGFYAKTWVPVTGAPSLNARSIAVADFNSDGKGDVVVTVGDLNGVAVFLGNGDGTFGSQRTFATGQNPMTVKVSDLNGDGKKDIVVGNGNSNDVSILLGNGDGTFATQVRYPGSPGAHDIAIGEFNGDGKKDLAVACYSAPPLSVLLGNGDGTFGPAQSFASGSDLFTSVAAAEFNGDGKQDLAIVKYFFNNFGIMLGNGNGTFPFPTFYNTSGQSFWVDAGDFNSDGKQDVAVANLNSDNVSVVFGNGDGTFQPQSAYLAGDNPAHVVASDVNGDGRLDLLVANPEPQGADTDDVVLLLNAGNGTFPARGFRLSIGKNSYASAVGDVNGDGKPDILSIDTDSLTISVLLNQGP